MLKNFTIHNCIYLNINNTLYDIHNYFDVSHIAYTLSSKKISIEFTGVANLPSAQTLIRLTFNSPHRIITSAKLFDLSEPSICEFGFKGQDDFDHDWILGEDKSNPSDDFFIRFIDNEFIRVNCRFIEATVATFNENPGPEEGRRL